MTKEEKKLVVKAIKEAFTLGNCSTYGCSISERDLADILATNNL